MAYNMSVLESETFENNPYRRPVGIEFEVCELSRQLAAELEDDGYEVKDEHCGMEICHNPANGDRLFELIGELCDRLSDCGVTHECGGHVHVSIEDFSERDVLSLLVLYDKYEEAIYSITPLNRHSGDYSAKNGMRIVERGDMPGAGAARFDVEAYICAVLNGSRPSDDHWRGMTWANELRLRKQARGERAMLDAPRYQGLNLNPWLGWRVNTTYAPTVEFRWPTASLIPDRVRAVVTLVLSLVEYAKSHDIDDILDLPDGIEGLLGLCGSDECRSYIVERYEHYMDYDDDDEWTDAPLCSCCGELASCRGCSCCSCRCDYCDGCCEHCNCGTSPLF